MAVLPLVLLPVGATVGSVVDLTSALNPTVEAARLAEARQLQEALCARLTTPGGGALAGSLSNQPAAEPAAARNEGSERLDDVMAAWEGLSEKLQAQQPLVSKLAQAP